MRSPARRDGLRSGLATLLCALLAIAGPARAGGTVPAANLLGTTGMILTPTAAVLPPDAIRFGVGFLDRRWSYLDPGPSDNYNLHLDAGFVPRVEVSLRASYAPKDRLGDDESLPEGNVDRGAAIRFLALRGGPRYPALAVGIDDAQGTRLFHSLYMVATQSVRLPAGHLAANVSLGYGSDALDATSYVLDGLFGGGELVVSGAASLAVEYDTEKWNAGARMTVLRHVTLQFVFLDLDLPSGGISWIQSL